MSERSLVGRTLGAYELLRLIGEGAGGAVYEARVIRAGPAGSPGTHVALKVIHPELVSDERPLQRFQREAELGMRIRNPHIVPSFECAQATIDGAALHYLAMQLVEGETLRHTMSTLRVVPEHLLYQIADQVLDALAAIHAEGMIHRDIKPENVLITPDHRILVMDLGVARLQQEGRDLTHAGEFVGSLVYAAPEQFTDQDAVGAAADVYALGVVLYELATGVSPFDAGDLHGLIAQKLQGMPRRPKSWHRELDPFLDEVILTCLRLDPDERFASAAALRQVLSEGTAGPWWAGRTAGGAFAASAAALAALEVQRPTPLLGRTTELEALHAAYAAVRGGGSTTVLVSGPAGVGKTRLVHDFLEDLIAPDGPRVWVGGVDTLPALPGEGIDDRPAVVFLDQADRAHPDTVDQWIRLEREWAERPVLWVVVWRSDELAEGAPLQAAAAAWAARPTTHTIVLDALPEAEIRHLLEAVLRVPRTVRALSGPLARTCAGNPHFLLEAIAHLKSTGALGAHDDGWAPEQPIHAVELPASLRGLLEQKLEQLDPPLLALLDVAAVQGIEFESAPIAAATGERRIRLLKHLGQLERRHRLIRSTAKGVYRFADPGLQQVLYQRIPPEHRRALHASLADALAGEAEALTGPKAFARVRHLLAADRADEAGPSVAAAAAYAMTSVHPSEAILFLRALGAALPEADGEARFETSMALAEMHRLSAATDAYRRALVRATEVADATGDAGLRGRAAAASGRAAWAAGHDAEAEAHATRGLELAARVADDVSRAACLEIIGAVAYRRGARPEAEDAWRQALALWERSGDVPAQARVLLRLARVPPPESDPDLPLETAHRALAMLREAGSTSGTAQALRAVGHALFERDRHAEALERFAEALALARRRGDQPAEAEVLATMARIHTIDGDWETARAAFEQALDIFRALEDPGGEARVLDGLGMAHATFGDAGEALGLLARARAVADRAGERVLLSRIHRHLGTLEHQTGSRDAAWAHFEQAVAHAPADSRSLVYADMGSAAERERDPDRAVAFLEQSLGAAQRDADRLLVRCRLARAHLAAARWDAAREQAAHAEALLAQGLDVAPQHGPEVLFSLGSVLVTEDRGRAYLEQAGQLVNERVRSIKSIVSRDRYLTMRWPNPEIFDAMRRLDASDGTDPTR